MTQVRNVAHAIYRYNYLWKLRRKARVGFLPISLSFIYSLFFSCLHFVLRNRPLFIQGKEKELWGSQKIRFLSSLDAVMFGKRRETVCVRERERNREKNQHVSSPNDIQTQRTMSSKRGWASPSDAQSFMCTTVLIQPRTCSTIDEKSIKRKSCTQGVLASMKDKISHFYKIRRHIYSSFDFYFLFSLF